MVGYAAPNAKVETFIDNTGAASVQSGADGRYSISISAGDLSVGSHFIKTRYSLAAQASDFSESQAFEVSSLKYPKADFNGDGKVDISDWSVFLYRWGSKDSALRATIDINGDGKVDIADFSDFLSLFQ